VKLSDGAQVTGTRALDRVTALMSLRDWTHGS
jgi:hypothetical protein